MTPLFVTRPFRRKDWLLGAAVSVVCCLGFSATPLAQAVNDAPGRPRTRPECSRRPDCKLPDQGSWRRISPRLLYFHPSEAKDGSFTITARVDKHFLRARIALLAPAVKDGVASWNGPNGGTAPLVELGQAHSEGACWRVGNAAGKEDETRLCAWNSKLAVDEPTPKEPPPNSKDFVYYGMRAGMCNAIESRSGIDTDHARIVTKKSRDAAIILCRG